MVASASINTWVHFAVTLESDTLRLYRDGIFVDSKEYKGIVDWSDFSSDLKLGSFDQTGTKFFDGKKDVVPISPIVPTFFFIPDLN